MWYKNERILALNSAIKVRTFMMEINYDVLISIGVSIIVALFLCATLGRWPRLKHKYVELLHHAFQFGFKKITERRTYCRSESEDLTYAISNISPSVILDDGSQLTTQSTQEKELIQSSDSSDQNDFHLSFIIDFIKAGVEAVIDDEVTKRFSAEELPSWNLLTRTNKNYHLLSIRLTLLWGIGVLVRYFILFPFRMSILIVGLGWLIICMAAIGSIPDGSVKRWAYCNVSLRCFKFLIKVFSATVTYHSRENRAKKGGICVANHTSPIDAVILSADNCYALTGQRHFGLIGVVQQALSRAASHVWFERCEERDREAVAKRLKEHICDPDKLPVLIFPEGTCINNTSVMMFRKGSFEVGGIIYPVAIKYDSRYGDPFWESGRYGFVRYLLRMMSSWGIVCDVWYLPPMTSLENETAVEFANRVKAEIANKAGLIDMSWDGQLKRNQAKKELKEIKQKEFSKRIKVE